MTSTTAAAVVPVALIAALSVVPGFRERAVDVPTRADPCATFSQSALASYRGIIDRALTAAKADAQANGTTGAYAVAATNARDLLQRSYDRATEMINFSRRSDPNTTTYAEAGTFKAYLQSILKWLPDAAHWATISAAYHRSRRAVDAFDGATQAMTRGSQLMVDAGHCYTAPYLAGAAQPG